MTPARRRRVASALATAALATGLAGCHDLAALLTGPKVQVTMALRALGKRPLEAPGTRLTARFVSDTVEVDGPHAIAYARGEVSGTYRKVKTECVCIEAVHFVRQGGRWTPDGFPLRRLKAVFDALDARQRAFEQGDVAAYLALASPRYHDGDTDRAALATRLKALFAKGPGPHETIVARDLRVERDRALVTETWKIGAHRGRAHYTLRREGDNWRFTTGLL